MIHFVVQRHRNSENLFLIHETATFRQTSVLLVLSVASAVNLDVSSVDIMQFYTCSETPTILVYVRPDANFGISPNLHFPIVRPLYVLADDGGTSWRTMRTLLVDELPFAQCVNDQEPFFIKGCAPSAIVGVYVDDLLLLGSEQLRGVAKRIANPLPV